jgi:hypothetical protein
MNVSPVSTNRLFTLVSCVAFGVALAYGSSVHAQPAALPDLTIDGARLAASADFKTKVFSSRDCAVVEGCVGGTGKRLLLRFDVATPNIGTADLVLGRPEDHPEYFEYSPCHGHYHFSGYARYELLTTSGANVMTGRKQAFCLEDFAPYSSDAGPAKFTCSYQGISVGWQDIYGKYLDCQWLDVTGVPAGNYLLRVTINPDQILTESDYSNNSATVPVRIPGKGRH